MVERGYSHRTGIVVARGKESLFKGARQIAENVLISTCASLVQPPPLSEIIYFRRKKPRSAYTEENVLFGIGDSILYVDGKPGSKADVIDNLKTARQIHSGVNLGIPGATCEEVLQYCKSTLVKKHMQETEHPTVIVSLNGNDWRKLMLDERTKAKLRAVGSNLFQRDTLEVINGAREIMQSMSPTYTHILQTIWEYNKNTRFLPTTPPKFRKTKSIQYEPLDGTNGKRELLEVAGVLAHERLADIITITTARSILKGIQRFLHINPTAEIDKVSLDNIDETDDFDITGHLNRKGHLKFAREVGRKLRRRQR